MSDLSFPIKDLLAQSAALIEQLNKAIVDMTPFASFGKAVIADQECYGFDEAAKILNAKILEMTGRDIGRNRLFSALRELKILEKDNQPYQAYHKYFRLVPKQTPIGIKKTTLFTGEGLAWVLPKLLEYYK